MLGMHMFVFLFACVICALLMRACVHCSCEAVCVICVIVVWPCVCLCSNLSYHNKIQSDPYDLHHPHHHLAHDFCNQVLQEGFQSIIFYCEWDKKGFLAGKAVARC